MRTQSQSEGSALPPSYFQQAKRQLSQTSQTHSEPEGYGSASASASAGGALAGSTSRVSVSSGLDGGAAGERNVTWAEPHPRVLVLSTARAALRTMHTEYTRYDNGLDLTSTTKISP